MPDRFGQEILRVINCLKVSRAGTRAPHQTVDLNSTGRKSALQGCTCLLQGRQSSSQLQVDGSARPVVTDTALDDIAERLSCRLFRRSAGPPVVGEKAVDEQTVFR